VTLYKDLKNLLEGGYCRVNRAGFRAARATPRSNTDEWFMDLDLMFTWNSVGLGVPVTEVLPDVTSFHLHEL
jgi:hypothetical protein